MQPHTTTAQRYRALARALIAVARAANGIGQREYGRAKLNEARECLRKTRT